PQKPVVPKEPFRSVCRGRKSSSDDVNDLLRHRRRRRVRGESSLWDLSLRRWWRKSCRPQQLDWSGPVQALAYAKGYYRLFWDPNDREGSGLQRCPTPADREMRASSPCWSSCSWEMGLVLRQSW